MGRYLGLKQIRHYGTERAVYEVDRCNPYNENFLKIIEEIRQAAVQHHKRVRCLHGNQNRFFQLQLFT